MGSTYSLSFEATLQNHNSFMNLEKETVVNFQMDKKFPWNKNFGYLHQASSTAMAILSESTKKKALFNNSRQFHHCKTISGCMSIKLNHKNEKRNQ